MSMIASKPSVRSSHFCGSHGIEKVFGITEHVEDQHGMVRDGRARHIPCDHRSARRLVAGFLR